MKFFNFKNLMLVTASSVLFVTLESCTESKGNNPAIPKTTDAIPVKIVSPSKVSVDATVTASGYLTTDDETILSFKTGGVVKSVSVREGDAIRKGQLLAILDLTEINALVGQATLAVEKAERELARAENLFTDSVATLEQVQNARTAFALAKSQLETAQFNRNHSQIRAQKDGFVLRKFVNPGQLINAGDPVVRTNGAAGANWILRCGVSDKQWSSININDIAELYTDAYPDRALKGKVVRKGEAADPATGAFTIEVAIESQPVTLASGMFATTRIHTHAQQNLWSVPYEAVLDADGNEGFIFVTTDNKSVVRKPVTIASFDGKSINISGGIHENENLVVAGSAYLNDGSQIIVVE